MRVIQTTANLYKFNKSDAMRSLTLGGGQFSSSYPAFTSAWWNKNNKNQLKEDTFEISQSPSAQLKPKISEIIEPSAETQEPKIPEIELNANDMILSYRLADCLHRLDDETIIYIGSNRANSKWSVKEQLTREDSFLPNPKIIKNVYAFALPNHASLFDEVLIAKDGDNIITWGKAKNLTRPDKTYNDYKYNNSFQFGDVLELECKVRLKFINTKRESNIPMYDAKYPVESFLAEGEKLTGGVVLNDDWNPNERIEALEVLANRVQKGVNKSEEDDDLSEIVTQNIPHRTFKNVAGLDDTIDKVKKQILYPMLYPKAFPDVTNCGTIFYGPPGTGKTLLAQAIIGEAKERKDKTINFINIDGQSLETKWIGDTEAAWRKVFKEAVEKQPCILFIDEIDAILSKRSDAESGGERHRNGVVSQFLTLISDIEKNKHKVWIIGATNRPELIDSAIKRSGRIGNMIEVKKPDEKGCFQILNHYLKDKNISEKFDRTAFANEIYKLGYTGADIANLVNKARDNMYERLGIYKQMDNNTFVDREMNDLEYIEEDFENSLT